MADEHPFTTPDGVTNITPWTGEQNLGANMLLGKLMEELGEATGRAARAQMAGLAALDPDTGKTNQEELLRELADIEAVTRALGRHVRDFYPSETRIQNKFAGFLRWMTMIKEMPHESGIPEDT